jgi:hypothetical protein
MEPSKVRTEACACVSEHGTDDEHAVPLPAGDTNKVLIVAARAATGTAATKPRPVRAASDILANRVIDRSCFTAIAY